MVLSVLILLGAFVALYFGAEFLVKGAVGISEHLSISKVIVGVALVAFGTSAPELFVNVIAAREGHSGLALSNVSGSNLANLFAGFGFCMLVGLARISRTDFRLDILFFALAPLIIVLFFVFSPELPLWGAGVLLTVFIGYFYLMKDRLKDETPKEDEQDIELSLPMSVVWFVGGILLLYVGGDMVVENALAIGKHFGISEAILGLTVVAFGTSIPDITASVVAVRRQQESIAVGNLLGSNIFNILLVLSCTLFASGDRLVGSSLITLDYLLVSLASITFAMMIMKGVCFGKKTGLLFLTVYVCYLVVRVFAL